MYKNFSMVLVIESDEYVHSLPWLLPSSSSLFSESYGTRMDEKNPLNLKDDRRWTKVIKHIFYKCTTYLGGFSCYFRLDILDKVKFVTFLHYPSYTLSFLYVSLSLVINVFFSRPMVLYLHSH